MRNLYYRIDEVLSLKVVHYILVIGLGLLLYFGIIPGRWMGELFIFYAGMRFYEDAYTVWKNRHAPKIKPTTHTARINWKAIEDQLAAQPLVLHIGYNFAIGLDRDTVMIHMQGPIDLKEAIVKFYHHDFNAYLQAEIAWFGEEPLHVLLPQTDTLSFDEQIEMFFKAIDLTGYVAGQTSHVVIQQDFWLLLNEETRAMINNKIPAKERANGKTS